MLNEELKAIKEKIMVRLDNVDMELKTQTPLFSEPGLEEWHQALTWVISLFPKETPIPLKPQSPEEAFLDFPQVPGIMKRAFIGLENNTSNDKIQTWLNSLKKIGEDYCLPGVITCNRPKAIAFQITGKNQIWIPKSIMIPINTPNINGVVVKKWWLQKNLDKIGE